MSYNFKRNKFVELLKVIAAAIISIIVMAIPTAISYGLYNLIDPITEIGRIISIIALVCIGGPLTFWFVILGAGLFVGLLMIFDS